jgi:hypothetical protein
MNLPSSIHEQMIKEGMGEIQHISKTYPRYSLVKKIYIMVRNQN